MKMENAEVLFQKMKDTTLSRFFGSADRTGIEIFTRGVMEPLDDPVGDIRAVGLKGFSGAS